ncbi:MAG: hypothetical protein ACRDGE_12690 [Candidatus Limnocylindria bacterium]
MGKGWAKGLTAASDPRVARMASTRRGMTYRRHLPPERDGRYGGRGARTLPLEWSEKMAYVVGLMATDGCLINTGRHLSFDTCDRQLVETFLDCLGLQYHYQTRPTRTGGVYYKALFGDISLYRWLESIGLHQRKSLTLGAIDVPDEFLLPLVRGLLDGDGTISNFVHAPTRRKYPQYRYERLWVFFNSASVAHLDWLATRLTRQLGIKGIVERRPPRPPSREFFRLKYGKYASRALLAALYPNPEVPRLVRKWRIWADYAARNDLRERW